MKLARPIVILSPFLQHNYTKKINQIKYNLTIFTYILHKRKRHYCLSNIYKLSKSIPVPSATQVSGDSAINTGTLSS